MTMELSNLPKTWIFDIDGTIVKHNGYLIDGFDTLLDGVKETFEAIDKSDIIILLTARKEENLDNLKKFLKNNNIHYDYIISNIPVGERILINDKKPSGLKTAYSINKERDKKLKIDFTINDEL